MLAAHKTAPQPFTKPASITEVEICAPSGMLPSPHCQRTRYERFIRGTEPVQPDHQFQMRTIDMQTGLPATGQTDPDRIGQRVYWLLPPEYHQWMISQRLPIAPFMPESQRNVATNLPGRQAGTEQPTLAVTVGPSTTMAQPLVLTSPASNIAYQIHPGVPRARQRILVAGYANGSGPWHHLRLLHNGRAIAEVAGQSHLQAYWTLEEGIHYFALEGVPTPSATPIQTDPAIVFVTPFQTADAISLQIPSLPEQEITTNNADPPTEPESD
jgi:hypothetical protein